MAVFICPSRRPVVTYAFYRPASSGAEGYTNVDFSTFQASGVARSDYAGNSGSVSDPNSSWPYDPSGASASNPYNWTGPGGPVNAHDGGVIYQHSAMKVSDITDGLSNTLLCGEKNITPTGISTAWIPGDNQGWTLGWDYDVARYTYCCNGGSNQPAYYQPTPDTPGYLDCYVFGRRHLNGFMVALLRRVGDDAQLHDRLANLPRPGRPGRRPAGQRQEPLALDKCRER